MIIPVTPGMSGSEGRSAGLMKQLDQSVGLRVVGSGAVKCRSKSALELHP